MKTYNATMTRETWTGGTYSHGWGVGAITGVAGGIMGIVQTAPAFGTFTVKPRIGSLRSASIKVPSLRGFITVNASGAATAAGVPCGSVATLCLAHGLPAAALQLGDAAAAAAVAAKVRAVRLDGDTIEAGWALLDVARRHVCVREVGCGAGGAPRTVTFEE